MKKILSTILVLVAAVSCSTFDKTISRVGDSNQTLRKHRVETLPNGLKIFFIEDPSLPRLSLQLLMPVGTVSEPQERAGLNAMTVALLDQGTQKKKALEIADLFADSGSEFESAAGADFTVLSTSSLTTEFPKVLDLFVEVLLSPEFPLQEIERTRHQVLVQLKGRQDRSGPWADLLMAKNYFQNHPYGRDTYGTPESVQKMNREEIIQFFKKNYIPNGARLALTGRLTPEIETEVRKKFGQWKSGDSNLAQSPEFKHPQKGGVLKLPSPHKAQTEIRFIQRGVSRNHPDFLKLRIANEILGGSFASRLNQRVRDDLGLTYSIYSSLDPKKETGSWIISTFSKNPTAQQTVDEVFNVLKKILQEGVSAEELKAAKNLAQAQFPRSIETADRLAYNMMALDFYGVPLDYFEKFNQLIDAITLDQVNKAIKEYLKPDQMQVLVYGQQ
jgi:zinc protease